jgi:WXG100 family type VII secretion target
MAMTSELMAHGKEILNKSGDMKNIRTRLSGIMQDMKAKFASINSSWDTTASAAYQTQFNKVHKDIEEMLSIVDEYTIDLESVAHTYITTEQQLTSASEALPTAFGT